MHVSETIRSEVRHPERETYQRMMIDVLDLLNRPHPDGGWLREVVQTIHRWSGLDAVAVRVLREGEEMYEEAQGFSEAFTARRNASESGTAPCNEMTGGRPATCFCGVVMRGLTESGWPCASPGKSCWTNYLPRMLTGDMESAFPYSMHTACWEEGFHSLAVVPLRGEKQHVGILHLADRRPDVFDEDLIEYYESIGRGIGFAIEREQTKAALQKSQSRFFHLFSHMSNGVMICRPVWNGRDFICTQVNDAFERITRVRREQIVGHSVLDGLPGLDKFDLVRIFQRVWRTGKPEHKPLSQYDNRGLQLWVEDYIFKLPTGEVAAVLDDVTARKRAENRLQDSYRRARELEAIVNESPAVCFVCHAEHPEQVTFITENIRQFGYTADDFLSGRIGFADMLHAEDGENLMAAMRDCASGERGGDGITRAFRVLTQTGAVRWLSGRIWPDRDEEGRVLNLQGVVQDITEQKMADMALAEQYRFMQRLIDTIPSPIFYKDRRGRYLGCNAAFEEFTGRTRDEIIGQCAYDIAEPELARQYEEMDHRLYEHPGTQMCEARVRYADGSLRDVVFTKATFGRGGTEAAGVVGVMIDLTEQHRMEEERREAERRERQSMELTDRLHSLGLLASGMAHEINNPLQGMLAHLHAAIKAAPDDFERRDSLEMIEKGIETIAALVRQLLALGNPENHTDEKGVFDEALQFVMRLTARQMKQNRIEVRTVRIRPGRVLALSQSELIQVLLNLFINARDAMPSGGTLTLTMDEPKDGEVTVRVSDTGRGMSEEELAHAFTPFFTTKGAHGTGLGLTVAESIVRNHGGRMTAGSRRGKGTEFIITLPLANSGTAQTTEENDEDECVDRG